MIYPFSPYLYEDENQSMERVLAGLEWPDDVMQEVQSAASGLVSRVRDAKGKAGQLEAFLQEFSLSSEEGLAMMGLAEALLRIPDAATANALIRDKVAAAAWLQSQGDGHKDLLSRAAGFGMSLSRKTLDSVFARLGQPIIREAMVQAMYVMGRQFVFGASIEDAISHAPSWEKRGYRLSYDMLGEGARDAKTAEQYFESYAGAIKVISANNGQLDADKPSISVKLSALHPRYTYSQKDRCIPEISEKLSHLARLAAAQDMALTVDAEEVSRLGLSVAIFERVLQRKEFKGWDGFGLAVQAYQKRALPLIDYIAQCTKDTGRRIQIRLVKGAYWDYEIKRTQMGGFEDYPVYTRKRNTDVSYLACAQLLFRHSERIFPLFATHNAHSMEAIKLMAGEKQYELQRLHGMGERLYELFMAENTHVKSSIYAPVGPYKDLLPYLVRRLLENGANSSFVHQLLDKNVSIGNLVSDPVGRVRQDKGHRHKAIALPGDLFGQERKNSKGYDLDDPYSTQKLVDYVWSYKGSLDAHSLVSGQVVNNAGKGHIEDALSSAGQAFQAWNKRSVAERSACLRRLADLYEVHAQELIAILVHEAGKVMPDACAEIREAVDFCRYYAAQADKIFDEHGVLMPGYTGEANRLRLEGRGVFVCISPWNFPLAIFTGQVVAALVAGNCVIAKPAPQTPYVAQRAVELMHEAGVPQEVLHLLLGDGPFGAQIVEHKQVAGVAFTGSLATAKSIQRSVAAQNDVIIPLIAETGGQNVMIIDSSALMERAVDDVIQSAFGSAGQRCSALRVVYVQEDIADSFLDLLSGAMDELRVTDPKFLSADIGYIIDINANNKLSVHADRMRSEAKEIKKCALNSLDSRNGQFFAPIVFEISGLDQLQEEVFGPVLHVVRFKENSLRKIIKDINDSGFGLTFGLQSRISNRCLDLAQEVHVGNVYVNRSMIGAVVGVQPFGGMGRSGTGPKAGGPNYLYAFSHEKHVSIDTTASGGNASLIALGDD